MPPRYPSNTNGPKKLNIGTGVKKLPASSASVAIPTIRGPKGEKFSAIANEIDSNYNLRDADQNEGTTKLITLYQLSNGDKIKFVASGTKDAGTPVLVPAKTRLFMKVH